MDRETANLVIDALGGYVTHSRGVVSICALSTQAQEIADLLSLDFERIDLDEEIDSAIRNPMKTDKITGELMAKSHTWQRITDADASSTLTLEAAKIIEEALWDRPGAVVLEPAKDEWRLWIKVGPESPVYLATGSKRDARAQLPDTGLKRPLRAILVVDTTSGYKSWDFGSFDGTNWNAHAHGLITGLTCKVIKSVELPAPDNGGTEWNP